MFQFKRFLVFLALLLTFSGCELKCDANVESKNAEAKNDNVEVVKTESDSTFEISRKIINENKNVSAGTVCIEGEKYAFLERSESSGYSGGIGVGLEETGETCSQ